VAYAVSGLYSLKIRRGLFDELLKIIVASSAGIMTIIIYIFLRQELFDSRFLVLGGWVFAVIFVFVGRLLVFLLQKYYVTRQNFGIHNVVVIGDDDSAVSIVSQIKNQPHHGYRLSKHFTTPDLKEIQEAKAANLLDEVILTNLNYSEEKILELVNFCHDNHIVFKYIPNIYKTLTANFDIDVVGGFPLIELKRTKLDGWGKVAKRSFDVLGSMVGLILLSPVFLIVSILIKTDTPGSVFVSLRRVSKNKEFDINKFRSMIKNAHDLNLQMRLVRNDRPDAGPLWKMKDDPRITRVGKFIRRTRIDELPQLWNVLKGDMSLVGPRPHQPDEIEKYEKHHRKLLAIKAGATGLAQVSGSSDISFEQEVTLDTYYIENWSLGLDLKIILKTIFKIFTDRSAV